MQPAAPAKPQDDQHGERKCNEIADEQDLDRGVVLGQGLGQRVVDAARRVAAPRDRVRFAQVRVRVDERGPQHGAPGVQPARARQGRRVVDGHAGYRAAGEGHVAGHRALRVGGGSQGLVGEACEWDGHAPKHERLLAALEGIDGGLPGKHPRSWIVLH